MYIPLWQSLPPCHLLPAARERTARVFPLDQPLFHAFYYARIGMYHLACKLCRLGYEKALFPAYHHGTEVTALEAGGMNLVFYNVHSDGSADFEDLEAKIGEADPVLFVTHYNGFPQDMNRVLQLKEEYGLILIEDVALSLLSRWGDRYLGQFGEVGIFCPYKTFPIPNGGVLLINDDRFELDVKVRRPQRLSTAVHLGRMILNWLDLRTNGMGQKLLKLRPAIKFLLRGVKSDPVPIGDSYFNREILDWAMSEVSYRILERCDAELIAARRRANYRYLLQKLDFRKEIRPMYPELREQVVPLFFPLLVESREEVFRKLQAEGVESSCFWKPWLPHVPAGEFPEVDYLRKSVLELPCHQDLGEEQLDFVLETLDKAVR